MTTGLMGGTFDPPHFGHLVLVEEARLRFGLESVLFIPSRIPPHKNTVFITDYVHRKRMIELAVKDNPFFRVADLEPEEYPSYTVDLINKFFSKGERPVFIMGMDSLLEIHTWKDPDRFLDTARVVVGTRPGCLMEQVRAEYLSRVEVFEIPGLWISSTDLRNRFARHENTRYLTPGEVRSYIMEEDLYGEYKGHRQNT